MISHLNVTNSDYIDAYGNGEEDIVFLSKLEAIGKKEEGDEQQKSHWKFEVVPGFFKQSDDETNDMEFNYSLEDLGRKKSWEAVKSGIRDMNEKCGPNEIYKVFFLARHGQGYHNVAHHKYKDDQWQSKWRYLGTDGEIIWGPDPELTALGVNQAEENNGVWKRELSKGAPVPSRFFCSPLRRSAQTLDITWKGIDIPRPLVCEDLREVIGLNLCHKRSTKSAIQDMFPSFRFEDTFPEQDVVFDGYNRKEKNHEHFFRIHGFLQSLFEEDIKDGSVDKTQLASRTFISITSHAGTIRGFLINFGHRKFTIPTGGMIPVVVRGSRCSL